MDNREDEQIVEEPVMISMSDYENGVSFDDDKTTNNDSNSSNDDNASQQPIEIPSEINNNESNDNLIPIDNTNIEENINQNNDINLVNNTETVNIEVPSDNTSLNDTNLTEEDSNKKKNKKEKKDKKNKKIKDKNKDKDAEGDNSNLDNNLDTNNIMSDDNSKAKSKKNKFKFREKSNDDNSSSKVIYLFPKKVFDVFSLLVVALLMFYIAYLYLDYKNRLDETIYSCTPVDIGNEKTLDINSTLVQDLYKKVKTTILEDYAQPEWDNTMRLYLAYRQLHENDFYESKCTLFKNDAMEPYKCDVNGFTPRAFKVSSLVLEWKKLFGEETPIKLDNIKLKNSCIGGFQYIPERDEFVEGYCDYNTTTSFKVTKSLKEAITDGGEIILKEDVKYQENEKMEKPSYLRSGTYIYTFKLDMNYNYVLVSKIYDER